MLEQAGFSRANPYNIVSQGQIAEMTEMSAAQRLNLLKEIGGARTYEEKRAESEQQMATVQEQVATIDENVRTSTCSCASCALAARGRRCRLLRRASTAASCQCLARPCILHTLHRLSLRDTNAHRAAMSHGRVKEQRASCACSWT